MCRLFERVPALAGLLRPLLVPDMELCRSILFDKTPSSNGLRRVPRR